MSLITAFRASKLSRVGLAALVASIGFTAMPTAAFAEGGESTSPCGPPQSPASGTIHAQIRNCTISFYEDTTNGVNHFDMAFELRDHFTDGVCAKAVVATTLETKTYTECNGVWQHEPPGTDPLLVQGWVPSVTITLSYGGHSPVSKTFKDPYPKLS